MRTKYHLLLSLLFLLVSFANQSVAADHEYDMLQEVQGNLSEYLDQIEVETDVIRGIYETSPQALFSSDFSHDFLVFQKDSLVYWSDFEIIIDKGTVLEAKDLSFVSLGVKDYLLSKQSFNNGLTICGLIYIQTRPRFENEFMLNTLNEELFGKSDLAIKKDSSSNAFPIVLRDKKLFYMTVQTEEGGLLKGNYFILCCYILLYLIGYLLIVRKSTIGAIVFLISLRALSLFTEYPWAYFSEWWFDPKVYAASQFSPSIADFFVNAIILALIVFHWSKRLTSNKKTIITNNKIGFPFAVNVVLLLGFTFSFYWILKGLYENSQYDYNFFSLTSFPALEMLYAIIFVVLSYAYIIALHSLIQQMRRRFYDHARLNILVLGLMTGAFIYLGADHWYLYLPVLGLFFLALRTTLTKTLAHVSSSTYVYAVLLFICAAWVPYSALKKELEEKEEVRKSKFADQLLNKHDPIAEYLLSDALKDIDEDAFIKSIILDPSRSKSVINQKVLNIFLNKYFDRYNVEVHLFNNRGLPFDESTKNTYLEWEKDFGLRDYATEYDNVYFHDDMTSGTSGRLIGFSNIVKNDKVIGSVVIDLKMKKVIPSSVYPKLLIDQEMTKGVNKEEYYYAFYNNDSLVYSYGNINYPQTLTDQANLANGFGHFIQEGEHNEKVVISSKKNYFLSGNFSYHFLLITFSALLISIVLTVIQFSRNKTPLSFAMKIRLFLGGAFFLPLIIITISLISIINNNYKLEKEEDIIKTSEGLNDRLASLLDDYSRSKLSLNELATFIKTLSINSGTDQNIYDPRGELIFTSQPGVFEGGFISKRMNPKAVDEILLQSKKYTLLNEQIEGLQYNAIYWAIHSNYTGQLIAVLHLPFYNAKEELAKREFAVFSIVINVFSIILIITVLVYPLTINSLTAPLKLIASKLKKTSFRGENEKIEWNSPDELGILVQQYNEMIGKLEESKLELAKQEKEQAWREMAQQVAHEIKNPLTPMKLTLQHLQRTEDVEAVKKAMSMMLTQIDTLNDIATSFSSFAKMPEPSYEVFNLSEVVQKGVQLYANEKAIVKVEALAEGVSVRGDENLMGRIMTNLILNGIQSVDNEKLPEITISLKVEGSNALLSVADNGNGIPEDVRDKVFIPNFSTKYTGSGIGLAVAKRGVEHAGGKIWFETLENKGTTFYIQLPIVQE